MPTAVITLLRKTPFVALLVVAGLILGLSIAGAGRYRPRKVRLRRPCSTAHRASRRTW